MKNLPKKIYLQIDADGETPEDFKELHGVSWCEDKINDNDCEYLLQTLTEAQINLIDEITKYHFDLSKSVTVCEELLRIRDFHGLDIQDNMMVSDFEHHFQRKFNLNE